MIKINKFTDTKGLTRLEKILDKRRSSQNNNENILVLLAIDLFKKQNNYEIILLFSNNGIITLEAEIMEVTLEDLRQVDD